MGTRWDVCVFTGVEKIKTDEERKALCEAMDNDLAIWKDERTYSSDNIHELFMVKGALSTTAIYLEDKYLCRIEFLIPFSDYKEYRHMDDLTKSQKSVLVNYIYYYDMTNVTLKCHMQIEDGF